MFIFIYCIIIQEDIPETPKIREGFEREELLFFKLPNEVGNYDLVKTKSWIEDDNIGVNLHTSIDDGDVGGNSFYMSEVDSTSTVSITKIEGDQIWGTFNVTLYKDTSSAYQSDYEYELKFTNGVFHTKILN